MMVSVGFNQCQFNQCERDSCSKMPPMTWCWNQMQNRIQQWYHRLDPNTPAPNTPAPGEAISPVPPSDALPSEQLARLGGRLQQLGCPPIPPPAEALAQALDRWHQDPQQCNGLAVLASPVDPIAEVIEQVLAQIPDHLPCQTLAWSQRPDPGPTLAQQVQSGVRLSLDHQDPGREVVVIPRLEVIFLRAMFGLEGIEWLQAQIFDQRSRFWLVGCPDWAWAYLDRTLQLGSHFDAVVQIPGLDPEQLCTWLEPVWQEVKPTRLILSQFQSLRPDLSPTQDLDPAEMIATYFKALAEVSKGHGTIAAQLWLRSLGQIQPTAEASPPAPALIWKSPSLPSLPDLTNQDEYLLHAVLLHGSISLPHLALSLGSSVSVIQSQVQILRRAGLLQLNQGILSVAPIHYLKLRSLLAGGNFLVGDP